MSSPSYYSTQHRISAWVILLHYLFSLFLLTIPSTLRAQSSAQENKQTYILYQKPANQSWQQIQQQLAPDSESVEQDQQKLAQKYGLTLKEWLLLPDNGTQTLHYPGVRLVFISAQEDPADVAFRYHLSPEALKELNGKVKNPEQLSKLQGQWVIVPLLHDLKRDAVTANDEANSVRDRMASVWGSAQQNGAGNALRDSANSAVNAALTEEVEDWLSHGGGKARVTADVGIGSNDSRDVGLDYLWPVKIWQNDVLFTQMSVHRWNDRNTLNLGLGWRHNINENLLAGGNVFFDQDITRRHNRVGLGGELWSSAVRTSANYYIPLSGWRESHDTVFNDDPDRYKLYERAARGWDLNLETALSQHVSAKVGWFQWYGDKVDVNGSRSEASRNPHGINLGLNWQPVPLLGINAEQSFISGQSNNFSIGLNFNWEFGRRLSEMLSTENATALPSLAQSRTEFVTRNNNIVLAYKQVEKDRRLYFSPTERTTPAGIPLEHPVKGGQGGQIRYSSSNALRASVDELSGRVDPKQRGDVAITATETSPLDPQHVLSSASYHLSITPGAFAPSVADVTIAGEMAPGNTLEGRYSYLSNEGEDEDTARTALRWIDKATGKVLKEGSASWTVSADDMSKTLIFQVTPFNKKGVDGLPGEATISGSAQISALRIDHLLTPGEVRPDGSVKFFAENNGALLILAVVRDGKGAPLADQFVYWQSQNALGHLSQNSVRTDSHGQALVKMEGIMAGGHDQIMASLSGPVANFSSGENDDSQRENITLEVSFAQPSSLSFIQPPEKVIVGSAQKFTVKVTDQDGDPFNQGVEIVWQSNGQPVDQATHTNDRGEATITLNAPTLAGTDWKVSAAVQGEDPVTESVSLLPDTMTAKVSELTVLSNNAAANGSAVNSVKVKAEDANGNALANQTVSFTADHSASIPASGTTDEEGFVTVNLTSKAAGKSEVTASLSDSTLKESVDFVADTTTAKVSEMVVVSNNAVANGVATNSVKVTVKDANENPVVGQVVNFDAGTGVTLPATGTTDENGTVTVTQTSKTAGEFQINATIGDSWLHAKSEHVTFVADTTTAKVSELVVVSNNAVANGVATNSVKATVKDANENPVVGQVVNFDAGTGVTIPATGTTDENGIITVTQTSLKAGKFQVNATVGNSWMKAKHELITFVADSSTAKVSELVVVSNNAVANGTATNSVKAKVEDANGNVLANQIVGFTADHSASIPASGTTDEEGYVTVNLTSKAAGSSKVTASLGSSTMTESVIFVANSSTAKVSELVVVTNNAVANGTVTNSVKAKVEDANGNVLANQTVGFSADHSASIPASGTTDEEGYVTVNLTSKAAGSSEVTASIGSSTMTETVIFVADSSTAKIIELVVVSNNAVANGIATNSVKVKVEDANGNVLANQNVGFTADHSASIPASGTTGEGGYVTVNLTSKAAGSSEVTASLGSSTMTESVTFVADSSTAKVSELVVVTNNAVANGAETTSVKATVIDANDNLVVGQAVSFDAGTGVTIPTTGTTGEDGTVTVAQTSKKAGEFQINATIGNNWLHAKIERVTFVADISTAKVSELAIVTNNAIADGIATNSVKATVKDANDNVVTGQKVDFQAGTGVSIPTSAETDSDGQVTVMQTSLRSGTFEVAAVIDGKWLTEAKSQNVNFVAGDIDPDNSTLTPETSSAAVAAGSTLTLMLKDAHNNPVSGRTLTTQLEAGSVSNLVPITWSEGSTKGTYTAHVNGTKTGTATVMPQANGVDVVRQPAQVTLTAGAVNKVKLGDSPQDAPADGESQVTWTVSMADAYNNPVSDATVNWTFPQALATKVAELSDSVTDVNGNARLTLKLGTTRTEDFTVKATSINNIEDDSSIKLTPVAGSIELEMVAAARVDEPVTLKATVKDKADVLMPGITVTFTSNHPDWMAITPENATTDSNGVATSIATIRPEKGPGAMGGYTLTAKASEATKTSKTLQLSVGNIDFSQSTLTPSSSTIAVGNVLPMVMVIKDKFGNPITGLTGRIGAVLADSQGRSDGGLIHTGGLGGITETEKGTYPVSVQGTRADTYTVTPIVDRVELTALQATVNVLPQKPWISGKPQIGYSLTIGKGSGFATATVNWKANGVIYRSNSNVKVDNESLALTDLSLLGKKLTVELIDSRNPSLRMESGAVTILGTPTVSNVRIEGNKVFGNTVEVFYDFEDNSSGGESGTQYQWYSSKYIYDKNPSPIPGARGKTLQTNRGNYGMYLYVSVTPRGSSGGTGESVMNKEYFGVTDSGRPSISDPYIQGEARVGQTIEVMYTFYDNGSGKENSSYQWYSWDEFSGYYREIDGATSKKLTISEAYRFMKNVRVRVTPRGTMGSQMNGESRYTDPVNIVN